MAGEAGFSDVVYDLISVQYHALKGCHEYDRYAQDAEKEGQREVADFFRDVMRQDAERAAACHRHLARLSGTPAAGPAVR